MKKNPTWKLCLLLASALLLPSALQAAATLPFYEPFPSAANPYNGWTYGGNENLGVAGATTSGNVWTFGNSASSTSGRITTGFALSYPGLTNIDSGGLSFAVVTRQNNTSTKDRGVGLTVPANPSVVYASCLVNIINQTNPLTTYPYPFFGLTTNSVGTSVSKSGATVFFDSTGHLLIGKNSATPATNTTYALGTNATHMIVIRYKFNPGLPDQVDLWLDPASLGNNATVPSPTLTTTNNANVNANYFNAVAYFASPQNLMWIFDEVRADTTWAGVTTPTTAPGNLYAVGGGGNSGCAGDTYSVTVSGSDSGVDYQLFTNGVFNGLVVSGNGSALSFINQSTTARYTVLASNTVSTNVGWMSGVANITVLASPVITAQPLSAIVATNGLCTFDATASGGGLHYQWYRNGSGLANGGHYSGTQTASLIVSPATSADVATAVNGYYLIITNSCGASAISATNALTLNPPASLVWSGDGATNVWDVGISPEWNTQSTVFHFGDNVVFDDTFANTTANLVAKNLSPSTVRVNGSQNFIFANGGGGLVGSGSVLMNGTGTLNLNAPNSMSGGLVVSNGVASFNSGGALGTGTITLAGGILNAINSSSLVVGNPVVVTADSTIRINNTTGSALTMTNTFTGVAGTLTFRNNVGSKPFILLTSSGFNFTQPVLLDIGSGTGLVIFGNNTTGTQTFSGSISGLGSIGHNGAGGTTLLTASNTYSGGTTLNSGSIAIGIDSVSSSPPTVDSGALGTGTLTIDTGAAAPTLLASGGAHSVDNAITYSSATIGAATIIGGTNNFTFNGAVDLMGDRTLEIDNGKTVFTGVISDGGITKTGNGALYLNGANTYTDPTVVSNGTLGGTGTIAGDLVVASGATLAPGASVGTLTVGGNFTLNGNLAIEVNKSLAPSNDLVAVTGTLTNGGSGTLTVSNLGSALVVGDSFTVFSQALSNGAALTVTGGGANWTNKLAVDGSIQVLSLASGLASYSTNITATVSGSTLTVGWPTTHLGWILQRQVNSLSTGLYTNWTDIAGSSSVTSTNLTINPANPAAFFRLRHP